MIKVVAIKSWDKIEREQNNTHTLTREAKIDEAFSSLPLFENRRSAERKR